MTERKREKTEEHNWNTALIIGLNQIYSGFIFFMEQTTKLKYLIPNEDDPDRHRKKELV